MESDLMKLVYSGECVSHFFYPWLFNGTNGQRVGGVADPSTNQGEGGKKGNETERDTDRPPLSPRDAGAFDAETGANGDGPNGDHTEHTASALEDQTEESHQPTSGSNALKRRTKKQWGEEKVKLSFVVPDTILYSYSKPISWFYTDPKTGLLCKRTKKELTTPMIVDSFDICGTSKSGLKAMYFTPAASAAANPFASLAPGHSNVNGGTNGSTGGRPSSSAVVDEAVYDIVTQGQLGRDGLFKFVQEPKGKGMLELVVDNKLESDGTLKNVVVHCEWTKTTFACEKWTSTYDLVHDRKRRLKDRLSMSPVKGDCIVSPIMAAAVKAQFKRVCEEIAECFESLPAGYRVLQLTVQCRIARNSKKNSKRKQDQAGDASSAQSPDLAGSASPSPDQQQPSSSSPAPSPTPANADASKAPVSSSDDESRPRTRGGTQPQVDHADRIASLVTILLVSCHSMKLMMPAKHPNKIFVLTPQGTYCQNFRVARRVSTGLDSNGSVVGPQRHDSTALQISSSQLAKSSTSIGVAGGPTPCRICQCPVRPEKVVEVELRWVLYALYLVDYHVNDLDPTPARADEVPLSVSLLCPQMIRQEFDELISGKGAKNKASASWYREKVNLCELCVEQCRASYHRMAELKLTPPDWLQVDGPKVLFNKGEGRGKNGRGANPPRPGPGKGQGQGRPNSPNVSAIAPSSTPTPSKSRKLKENTTTNDQSVALLQHQWSSFLGSSPSRSKGSPEEETSAYFPGSGGVGNSIIQGSITGWWVNRRRNPFDPKARKEDFGSSTQLGSPTTAPEPRYQVRIVIASKETPDAADLYSTGKGAVWKKIGFGVPEWEGQDRFLLNAPRLRDRTQPATSSSDSAPGQESKKEPSGEGAEGEQRPLNTIELKFLRHLQRKLQDVVEATSEEEEEDKVVRRSSNMTFDPPAPPDNSPAG